jgi:hypothetical protein
LIFTLCIAPRGYRILTVVYVPDITTEYIIVTCLCRLSVPRYVLSRTHSLFIPTVRRSKRNAPTDIRWGADGNHSYPDGVRLQGAGRWHTISLRHPHLTRRRGQRHGAELPLVNLPQAINNRKQTMTVMQLNKFAQWLFYHRPTLHLFLTN